ncbi:MAG: DUF3127 domain-containing protein [Mangrovibacterium sp.]
MEIQGKVFQVLPEQGGTSASGNAWKKQEFVVETTENPQYPKKVCFTLFGDRMSSLQGINPGDEVKVSFDVESREYQGRWFHNVNAWRVEQVMAGAASAPSTPPEFTQADLPPVAGEDDGDLPF